MLIDDVQITIKAGNGGDGLVHFYRDRWRPKGGPDGGNGGKGGDVYAIAVSDVTKLNQFRHLKNVEAENGINGGPNQRTGRGGKDTIIELPVGSIINFDNGTSFELTHSGQKEVLARGGKGGLGNHHFRSATNQTPQEFTAGKITETKNIHIQLKLIADVGLIGLPNAGKSSLLNELTPASAKVANYAFTTLEPNLGVTKGNYVIADVPGLIEGSSDGKGLGSKFLKHIERTSLLVHCVASDTADPEKDYHAIRKELSNYSQKLNEKPEIIVLTKSDLLEPKQIKLLTKKIKADLAVSIIDEKSIKSLNDLISRKLKLLVKG